MNATAPNTAAPRLRLDHATFWFIAMAAVVGLGFSHYFRNVFGGTNDYAGVFHFHGALAFLWVALLIMQPLFIRTRQPGLHRLVGRIGLAVMPLFIVSGVMVHHYLGNLHPEKPVTLFDVTNDGGLVILAVFYGIAVWKRHEVQIHARAMISTGIGMIQPASDRLFAKLLAFLHVPDRNLGFDLRIDSLASLILIVGLLVALIVVERRQHAGRWVFPLLLAMLVSFQCFDSLHPSGTIPGVDPAFGKWFLALPLPDPAQVEAKDLPIPPGEIDAYVGAWDVSYDLVTYKQGNELWGQLQDGGATKRLRFLYQGNDRFVPSEIQRAVLHFHVKNGKADSFALYFGGSEGRLASRKE